MSIRVATTALLLAAVLTPSVGAGTIDINFPTPAIDRWWYPFNATPGVRPEASTFGALGEEDFDDRDGQILLAWDTSPSVPAGEGEASYRILSARIVATISRDLAFVYDPTVDALGTYFEASDPDFVADADAGRPIEVFPVGYRNGFDATTILETTPFGSPAGLPARMTRHAFAGRFDASGMIVDASNQVDERVEAAPIGVGTTSDVTPGQPVPIETVFTFDLDLSSSDAVGYLRSGLNAGRVSLMLSSLSPVFGQGDPQVPAIQMKDDPFGTPARLELSVCVGSPADWDCSGLVDVFDLLAFLSEWFEGGVDLDDNGITDVFDLLAFLAIWFEA